MTDQDIGEKIQRAVNGIQPDAAAKERVRRRIQTPRGTEAAPRVRAARSRFRWLAPVCLFAVLTAASAGILGRELLGDRGETQSDTSPEIEMADVAMIRIDVNERITINGKVYRRVMPDVGVTEAVIGSVEFATDAALDGLPARATDARDTLALQTGDGELRVYEYFGVSDGAGGVLDDSMGDYFAARGIDLDSVSSVIVREPDKDVVTQSGEVVSYTAHRRTITEKERIRQLLSAFSALKRDAAGYETAKLTEQPYEGYISLTLIFDTGDGQRTAELICYPKIGYVFGGYRFESAFFETVRELIETEES